MTKFPSEIANQSYFEKVSAVDVIKMQVGTVRERAGRGEGAKRGPRARERQRGSGKEGCEIARFIGFSSLSHSLPLLCPLCIVDRPSAL